MLEGLCLCVCQACSFCLAQTYRSQINLPFHQVRGLSLVYENEPMLLLLNKRSNSLSGAKVTF